MSLTSKGHIKIGSTEFAVKKCNPTYESLASTDSGRTDDGTMHITWVLKKIRKVEIELPPCTASVAASVLSLVQGQIYQLTYWDILSNSEKTITVYTSNSKGECYNGVVNGDGLWQGVSFNAIETSGEN